MTLLTAESEEISLAKLHDLDPDEYNELSIEVRRRIEPGAGQFGGVRFLDSSNDITTFNAVSEALKFIDDLQDGGLPGAIRGQLGDDTTAEDILGTFEFSPETNDASAYLEHAGVTDPFNLNVILYKQYTREIEVENPQTTSGESEAEAHTGLQV